MNYSMLIPRGNDAFYREAYRAKNIKEINDSVGLKYLLDREIKDIREYAYQSIMNNLELVIEEGIPGEFILTLKDK